MTALVALTVEPFDVRTFAPFGEVLVAPDRAPDLIGSDSVSWIMGFHATGTTQMRILKTPYRRLRFGKLERHFNVTQAFVAIGGAPSVVAMAPPTDAADPLAIPRPEDVRAFLLNTGVGYLMRRGTWHSLDRFPLVQPSSEFLMLTEYETAVEATIPRAEWTLSQEVDYEVALGTVFQFVL